MTTATIAAIALMFREAIADEIIKYHMPDLQACISVQLLLLRLVERDPETRLVRLKDPKLMNWARSVMQRQGKDSQAILDRLDQLPEARRWAALRQLLPSRALVSLHMHLCRLEQNIHAEAVSSPGKPPQAIAV